MLETLYPDTNQPKRTIVRPPSRPIPYEVHYEGDEIVTQCHDALTPVGEEIAGGSLEKLSDIARRMGKEIEGLTEEDRKLVEKYIEVLIHGNEMHMSGQEDALMKSFYEAKVAFEQMSPVAKKHIDTDRFKGLLTRLISASGNVAY